MDSQEKLNQIPEILSPVTERTDGFINRIKGLNERAREKLPEEIRSKITPLRLIGEGIGKSALGITVDVSEGAVLAALTAGISELVPVTEIIADWGSTKIAEKITGRNLRGGSKAIGYSMSLVPFVGDFASPTLIDGVTDIYVGTRALLDANSSSNIQPALNSNLI